MLLVLTISVESLTGYDDIVWQFPVCTFILHDQPRKWERVLKTIIFGKHLHIFI